MAVETVAAVDRSETPVWVRTLLALAGTLAAMSVLVWAMGANPLEVARPLSSAPWAIRSTSVRRW